MTEPARKQEVARRGEVMPPAREAVSATEALFERMARDPTVDAARAREILQMLNDERARLAERAFNAAMTATQTDMRPVAMDSNNSQTKSRYASYFALDAALRPIYTRHGFALSFDSAEGAPENYVRVVCYVSHKDGHTRKYQLDMPADGKGAKGGDVMTKTHAVGSGMTYGRRYLLGMIFNVAVTHDDDGNAATGNGGVISAEQAAKILSLIEETGSDIEKFCRHMKVGAIVDIPKANYQRAIDALENKRAKSA